MTTRLANVALAASMVWFYRPLVACIERELNGAICAITLSAMASAFFHLHESQKHGMSGAFPNSHFANRGLNRMLLNVDRFFAVVLAIITVQWLLFNYDNDLALIVFDHGYYAALAFLCLYLSEVTFADDVWCYVLFHGFWHVLAAEFIKIAFSIPIMKN